MAINSVHLEGPTSFDDHFDIMVIGKTGLGKTTTADKLLLANPTGKIYSSPAQQNPPLTEDDAQAAAMMHCEDLSMWYTQQESSEMVKKRLLNLVECRSAAEPHKKVNELRKQSKPTKYGELLSNDTSKLRILDVPGFFGSEDDASGDAISQSNAVAHSNLQVMRNILHIKALFNFKFNRIIYFLPEQGVLNRCSQILKMEIATMANYFGHSIFECMVVVATHPASNYKYFAEGIDLYQSDDYDVTRGFFQEAMNLVFHGNVPQPPIKFLSYRSTCEEVLQLFRSAEILREGVELSFNLSRCAVCNATIKKIKGISRDMDLSMSADSTRIEIPYLEGTCHPELIPKYSKLQKFLGSIAHHLTLHYFYFKGRWPSFFEEICIACRENSGSRGCMQIGTTYFYRNKCSQCKKCMDCKECCRECRERPRWRECPDCMVCDRCKSCQICWKGIVVDHTSVVATYAATTEENEPQQDGSNN